jgi:hypothetical protein
MMHKELIPTLEKLLLHLVDTKSDSPPLKRNGTGNSS